MEYTALRDHQTETIEQLVYEAAQRVTYNGGFSNDAIRFSVSFNHKILLTFKQTRNALYRLREKQGEFYHHMNNQYFWI